jgi:hypothetical protein
MKNISAFIIALLLGFSSCMPITHVGSYDPSYGGVSPVTVIAAINQPPVYRPWRGWYYQNPTLVQPYLGNVYYRPQPIVVQPVRVTVPLVVNPRHWNGPRGGRRGR